MLLHQSLEPNSRNIWKTGRKLSELFSCCNRSPVSIFCLNLLNYYKRKFTKFINFKIVNLLNLLNFKNSSYFKDGLCGSFKNSNPTQEKLQGLVKDYKNLVKLGNMKNNI